MTRIQTEAPDRDATIAGARDFRQLIQDFAVERAVCDRHVKAGKLNDAEASLERARRVHDELQDAADARNTIHRRMVRNRRIDLSLLCGRVEDCRLKKQAASRRKSGRGSGPVVEGA